MTKTASQDLRTKTHLSPHRRTLTRTPISPLFRPRPLSTLMPIRSNSRHMLLHQALSGIGEQPGGREQRGALTKKKTPTGVASTQRPGKGRGTKAAHRTLPTQATPLPAQPSALPPLAHLTPPNVTFPAMEGRKGLRLPPPLPFPLHQLMQIGTTAG